MKKFGLILVGLFVTAGSAFAADGSKTVLATQKYVDSMYDVIDAAKVDAVQTEKGALVVTDTDGNVTTASTIDLSKISVPTSCVNDAALCVIAFRNGAWTIVDVTPDPENEDN